MPRVVVNRLKILWVSLLISGVVSCTPAPTYRFIAPFDPSQTSILQITAESGWIGRYDKSFKLSEIGKSFTHSLPLGWAPRRWSLLEYSSTVTLLWLDRAPSDSSTRLYGALLDNTLNPRVTLTRGPTLISTAETLDYASAALPTGETVTLWTAQTPGQSARSLYLTTLDQLGRPLPSVLISRDAHHPTLFPYTPTSFYGAWLEPGLGGGFWLRLGVWETHGSDTVGRPAFTETLGWIAGSVNRLQMVGDKYLLYILYEGTDRSLRLMRLVYPTPSTPLTRAYIWETTVSLNARLGAIPTHLGTYANEGFPVAFLEADHTLRCVLVNARGNRDLFRLTNFSGTITDVHIFWRQGWRLLWTGFRREDSGLYEALNDQ